VKLNGENYADWAFVMKLVLKSKGLWEFVGDDKRPEVFEIEMNEEFFKKKNEEAMMNLVLSVEPSQLCYMRSGFAYQAWADLKEQYMNPAAGYRADLVAELCNLKLESSQDFDAHYRKFSNIVEKLDKAGTTLQDLWGLLYLRTLPKDFEIASSIIKQSRESLSLTQMKARLQLEIRHEDNAQSALAVRDRPIYTNRQGKSECFICGEKGHWRNNCPKKPKRDFHGGNSASLAIAKGWAVSNGYKSSNGKWYWDSGATVHICSDKSMFSTFTPSTSQLEVADGRTVKVLGKGLVQLGFGIKGSDKRYIGELQDTLYAPDMKKNLISPKQLAKERDVYVSFGANDCILQQRNGQRILVGELKNDLYEFVGSVIVGQANLVSDLWHKRLGHISKKTLDEMVHKGQVRGVDLNEKPREQPCPACTQGKSTRLPFGEGTSKTSRPLELIHSDVCGPIETASLSGKRYLVTFIDDYSRYTHIYFLQKKSEVLKKFKEFTEMVKNIFAMENYRVSTLRSDNGGEYVSGEFANFCQTNGIVHQYTVPYTPEQNGVAERFNRTILESAVSMMSQAELGKEFWAEAVAFAVHIRNRVSSSSLDGKTPYELWHGRIPDLSHIRTFGSGAWTHVPKELRRGKLNAKSINGVLVGFSETSKAYRIYCPHKRHIVVARDVVFDENTLGIYKSSPVQEEKEQEQVVYLDTVRQESSGRLGSPMEYSLAEEGVENVVEEDSADGLEDRMSVDSLYKGTHRQRAINPYAYRDTPEVQDDSRSETSSQSLKDAKLTTTTSPRVMIEGIDEPGPIGYKDQRYLEQEADQRLVRYDKAEDATNQDQHNMTKSIVLRSGKHLGPRQEHLALPSANVVTNSGSTDPATLQQAQQDGEWIHWEAACKEELDSLAENQVWDLCKLPQGRTSVGSRWVFKKKYDQNGTLSRYKARLVAQGYTQTYGVDYQETFAPVVRFETIRSILAIAVRYDWELFQLDIKTAFLYGKLDEEIFMNQPPGFVDKEKPMEVCRLKRSLYGLKQAPRCWNAVLDEYLTQDGFVLCSEDNGVYKWVEQKLTIILAVYVDDMIVTGNNLECIAKFKDRMKTRFKMSDSGELSYFLGIQVQRDRAKKKLHLNQERYIHEILERYRMTDCNPTGTPFEISVRLTTDMSPQTTQEIKEMQHIPYQNAVGSLMYLVTATRPDLAHSVGEVSRFNQNPGKEHWAAVKRILRYLKGTSQLGILYEYNSQKENEFCGYSDADWGGDIDGRRSTSGYLFQYSNGPISWKSQKQRTVALSSTEAEYIALTETVKECIWLRSLFTFLGLDMKDASTINEDNQSCMKLAKNAIFHKRTKHIEIQYHFTREVMERKEATLVYCPTKEMVADMLTKYLPLQQFNYLRNKAGMLIQLW
jgi:hypothetical protein